MLVAGKRLTCLPAYVNLEDQFLKNELSRRNYHNFSQEMHEFDSNRLKFLGECVICRRKD
jgi:hypothetical protein